MSLITSSLILDLLGVVVALWAVLYTYFYRCYQYWEHLNVPYKKGVFPWGSIEGPFRRRTAFGLRFRNIYEEFKKKGAKYVGFYSLQRPAFLPIDLDLIKCILIKDFDHFVDRGIPFNEEVDPLEAHLFNIGGSRWRTLRTKLTPTFTSGKMKMMFDTLVNCAPFMLEQVDKHLGEPLDIKDVLGCFTTDVIGSCAFGLECNSLKDPDSLFRLHGKRIFAPTIRDRFRAAIRRSLPQLAHFFRLKVFPEETEQFFMDLIRDMEKYRDSNNVRRNDFLQLLIDMKDDLTFNEKVAQSFIFFIAGFETSATTMTFTLYNLAKHQDIQEKLRLEMNTVLQKHDNKITYEAINEMKYLAQVVDESLRMYPPLPFLNRSVVKDYKIPGENLVLKKGTFIMMSILGVHYDEDYYPEPEKFDPERFNDENKKNNVASSFLSFGDGPRNCIGLRFGLMQSKVGLATLLTKYRFTVNAKTQEPIKFHPIGFVLSIDGGCWLNAEKI